MFTFNVKPVDEHLNETVRLFYEHHSAAHQGDSGIDLFFMDDQFVDENSQGNTVKLGISCELLKEDKNYSYLLIPRSSISKTPLRMSNSIGLIDAGYRGELMVKIDNISDNSYIIKKGTSLFQLVNPKISESRIKLVEQLSETERGTGAFGSTGNN